MIEIPLSEIEFSYSRSSGPGGQNVNKVNSKALLRWSLTESASVSEDMRLLLMSRLAACLNQDGELVIVSDRFRDQIRNREDCLAKFRACISKACEKQKPRKKTRPTRASEKRRKEKKSLHSDKKRGRRKSGSRHFPGSDQ